MDPYDGPLIKVVFKAPKFAAGELQEDDPGRGKRAFLGIVGGGGVVYLQPRM